MPFSIPSSTFSLDLPHANLASSIYADCCSEVLLSFRTVENLASVLLQSLSLHYRVLRSAPSSIVIRIYQSRSYTVHLTLPLSGLVL